MLKSVLVNREYYVQGNWYNPMHKLTEFSSVVKVHLWDTTSSAGDWNGFFVQKIGKNFYVIPFFQVNYRGGYKLYTEDIKHSWRGEMVHQNDLDSIYNEISREYGEY